MKERQNTCQSDIFGLISSIDFKYISFCLNIRRIFCLKNYFPEKKEVTFQIHPYDVMTFVLLKHLNLEQQEVRVCLGCLWRSSARTGSGKQKEEQCVTDKVALDFSSEMQVRDIFKNKPFRCHLRMQFSKWYIMEITNIDLQEMKKMSKCDTNG